MNAKSVLTYYKCDINVNREWEGAGREPLCFSVCADLAFHIVHKLCFAATSSLGLWKIFPWLIDFGKVQAKARTH
jgi:hypothetical protein